MILVIDFSSVQTSISQKFQIYVAVCLTDDPLVVSTSLRDKVVIEVKAESQNLTSPLPQQEKRKRSTKTEMERRGIVKKEVKSLRNDIKIEKKVKKLSKAEERVGKYSPSHTHFHFILNKKLEHNKNQGITSIKFFTD